MKVHEIADRVGGSVKGNAELEIIGLCSVENARQGFITFLESIEIPRILTSVDIFGIHYQKLTKIRHTQDLLARGPSGRARLEPPS